MATEDEMVGWHHRLNGHEFEQTPGDSEEQEAWCAVVHGVAKSGHDLATEYNTHLNLIKPYKNLLSKQGGDRG